MPQPYKIFTIYAREDAQYLNELLGQLRPLELAGRIKVWSDREINPGVEWEKEIVQQLDAADIVLILVSAAYYNSVFIHEVEIKRAFGRHEKGEARVLPVIVRPCHFGDDPIISRLQALPTDGKPVTDRRHWPERDDAWLDVVAGVKRTLDALRQAEVNAAEQERLAVLNAEQGARRMRDEQARREREAEETAHRREQTRREQEAREREMQKVEDERRADQTAWQKAAAAHDVTAYETYLAQYPRGEYAREARARIKQLKRGAAIPFPMRRYAAIGGGALAILLAVWLTPKIFGGKEPASTQDFNYPIVSVEGGTFTMGSPANEAGRHADECEHDVDVGSFGIGKYEVTQAQWKAVMGNNPSHFKNCDDCPVENVSWNDVQDFIGKLNALYPGKKYRLPAEAEWEYAARGGKQGRGYRYAGSNTPGDVANLGDETHPVGGKLPNELGLYDMSGNVWEWCQDIYKAYPCDKETRGDGVRRVYRGGSWNFHLAYCRTAFRSWGGPAKRDDALGFRLVSLPLQDGG